MLAACQDPGRYAALVVVDIPPGSGPHTGRSSTVLRFYPQLSFLSTLNLQAYTTRSQLEAATCDAIPAKGLRDFLLSNVVRAPLPHGAHGLGGQPSAGAFVWQCNLAGILQALPTLYHTDLLAGQKPYPGPCLWVKAEHSDWICQDDLPSFGYCFPQHRLVTVPGADHNVHTSNPEGFLQALTPFLGPFVQGVLAD
jgi:pimeloyl-ACP methyl ester carboxylesterase